MAVQTYIDGTEVTDVVLEGSVTQRLNRPWEASVRMPSHLASGANGSRLKIVVNGSLARGFHGMIEHVEDQGDEDVAYTVLTAADPMFLWQWRPARDPDGDYSKPDFIQTNVTGPQIIEAILNASETAIANADFGLPDGPLFLQYGTFATGGVDLTGAPVDWPMTIAEIAILLTETGEVDIIITPIDVGSNMARVDVYNGDYGADLSGSVSFEWGVGAKNARAVRRTGDSTQMANKLRYLISPKVATKYDPKAAQHWESSIDGGAEMPNPPQAMIDAALASSRATYGTRFDIQLHDAIGDETVAALTLYRRRWQNEAWLRLRPKTLVHITPQRGTAPTFGPGDRIGVAAGAKLRGGFAGVQRVMELTYRWDENGVIELGEPVGMSGAAGVPGAVVTTNDAERPTA